MTVSRIRSLVLRACRLALLITTASAYAQDAYQPNNTIILSCDKPDGSYLNVQQIHTTITPQQKFIRRGEKWEGAEADWEGGEQQLQTQYLPAWSIEVHYDDAAVDRLGKWKKSPSSGNEYAVFVGKHVPAGLSTRVGFASRDEPGCMLSRTLDPQNDSDRDFGADVLAEDWHAKDWDFVETRMTKILNERGIKRPWKQHSRRKLVGALANWIKDARLSQKPIEENLHPVESLAAGETYCGGAANGLVAMCSILKIPARYIATADHGFVEFQNDDGRWLYVGNQPETFVYQMTKQTNPFDWHRQQASAKQWALEQNFDSVFDGGTIDLMANPRRFAVADVPHLGWFYNWSCPRVYNGRGETKNADLCARPQTLHDWVFNLYTGYGDYEGKYMRRRGMFMAERFNSVFELAAMYSPRRTDLPYVCDRRGGNDNVIFLTPFRDSYYSHWDNKVKVESGHAIRQQFYLSDLDGVTKVIARIILGPDDKVDHTIPPNGGDWHYSINGSKFHLNQATGFKLNENYQGTEMTVHTFQIPLTTLKTSERN